MEKEKNKIKYSIVIPAYNESDKITSSLTHVINFMKTLPYYYEIIVVDDGSSDETVNVVKDYIKENRQVVLVKNKHMGKAPTVAKGVKKAKGELIYIADADFSSPINEIKKMGVWIDDHDYDIVIGSREGTGAVRSNEPFHRHLMGRVFNLIVQILLLPGIKDSQCGFKLFKSNVAKELFSDLQTGMTNKELKHAYTGAWDVEILYVAKLRGYKIKEVSVTWAHVKSNRVSPVRDSLKMLLEVLKIKINSLTNKYN